MEFQTSRAAAAAILIVLASVASLQTVAGPGVAVSPQNESAKPTSLPAARSLSMDLGMSGEGSPSAHTESAPAASGDAARAPAAPVSSPSPASASPVLGPTFDGLRFGANGDVSNFWYPPDVQVAVGPSHIVEMVNLLIGIYAKDGTSLHVQDLASFFGVAPSAFISDPKIQYDAASGRWFATITDITTGRVGIAVSTSSDPTGPWTTSSISGTGCLDQPILGVGTDTVIVSVNVFSSCTARNPGYLGAQYWVLNKADLVAGRTPATAGFGPFPVQFSVHPVQVVGSSATHFMVSTDWIAGSSADSIVLYNVTGVPPDVVTVTPSILPIRTVRVPPNADQAGTRHTLDTSDIRASDAAWSTGRIWLGLNSECTPAGDGAARACVRLVEIDPANGTVPQDFDVGVVGKHVFYPGLRTDGAGNLVVGLGFSSASEFPGAMVAGRLAKDPPNTYQPPVLVWEGTGPEDPGACTSTCRYGDYFAASLDPVDPTLVWAAAQIGTTSGWGTVVFGARVKAILTLSYEVRGGGSGYFPPLLRYTLDRTLRTAALETSSATFAADPGSPWDVSEALPGSTEWEAWQGSGPSPFRGAADASMTTSFVYIHVFFVTFGYEVVGGETDSTPPRVSFTQLGLTYTDPFPFGRYAWVDAGTPYAYDAPLLGSSSRERWSSIDAVTGIVDRPLNLTIRYHHQFAMSFDYDAAGAPSMFGSPDVTYTSYGMPTTARPPASAWADAQTTYAFPEALPGSSASDRWGTAASTSGIVTGPADVRVAYTHQYLLTVTIAPATAGVVSPIGGWFDAGTSVALSATANVGWRFETWGGIGSGSASGTLPDVSVMMDGPIEEVASFSAGLTLVASGSGSIAYAYGTTAGTVPAGSTLTLYVPVGTLVSLVATPSSPYDSFGGWSGATAGGSAEASVRVDAPGTVVANFGPSFAYVIAPTIVVLGAVALLGFFLWRRRRKQWPPAR